MIASASLGVLFTTLVAARTINSFGMSHAYIYMVTLSFTQIFPAGTTTVINDGHTPTWDIHDGSHWKALLGSRNATLISIRVDPSGRTSLLPSRLRPNRNAPREERRSRYAQN
jgi:hypothetical protein